MSPKARLAELKRREKLAWSANISDQVRKRIENPKPISEEEYRTMRLNRYELVEILPHLSTEALMYRLKHFLDNCSPVQQIHGRDLPITYDEWVKVLAGELVRRLEGGLDIQAKNLELDGIC